MDVWIMHSRDEGRTWSQRIKVNQDTGPRYQFLPWMSVDPATGYIYIVYYDRRNHADTQTDVVVATSKDGGNTFKEILLTGSTFTPPGNEVFSVIIMVSLRLMGSSGRSGPATLTKTKCMDCDHQ